MICHMLPSAPAARPCRPSRPPNMSFSPIRLAYKGFLLGSQAMGELCRGIPGPGSSKEPPPLVPWASWAWFLSPKVKSQKCPKNQKCQKCQKNALALPSCQKNALALLSCQKNALALLSCQNMLWHCAVPKSKIPKPKIQIPKPQIQNPKFKIQNPKSKSPQIPKSKI